MLVAAGQPVDQLGHGVDLVAAELEVRYELKAVVKRMALAAMEIPSYHAPYGPCQRVKFRDAVDRPLVRCGI